MLIPATMQIEQAADGLPKKDKHILEDQLKELHSFGEERLQQLWSAMGVFTKTVDERTTVTSPLNSVTLGYLLGLEVARVIIAMTPPGVKVDL